ncbi:MAG: twin-arginine translocase subunit TatC [Candidatus Saccharibacteria bacterium]
MKRLIKRSRPATKLFDHIRELQMRLTVSVISLVVAGTAVYIVYEPLLALLRSPLNAPLYYSSPAGSFAFVMKICFMGALALTIPIIIYNLIMFIRPVFEDKLSLRRVYATTATSALLAISGALFGFVIIIPGSLKFFAGFQVSGLSALISADSYLNFVTNVIITFIIVFQLPLLLSFIDSIHPLPPKKLLGLEKWVIVGSLVISLLVPFAFDLTTMLLIALPIVVLYNLSIVMIVLQGAHKRRKARSAVRVAQRLRQLAMTQASALSQSDLSFEAIPDELWESRQPAMPYTFRGERVTQRAGIDIRRRTTPPEVVVRRARNRPMVDSTALASQVRIISDVRRRTTTNRALA